MTYPLAIDNNCVKYYQDPTRQWGITAWKDFGHVCTVTLILEIWHWAKVMTHPWVMDNKCEKYHPDPTWQWGVMAGTQIFGTCPVTLTLEILPWVKVMTHPKVMDNNFVKYYPDSTRQWGVMIWTRIFGMCALWPWQYGLGSRSWHTLGSWITIVWNIIQLGQVGKKLWPGHDVNRRTDSVIPIYHPNKVCRGGGL